jgi:hypothetical protein
MNSFLYKKTKEFKNFASHALMFSPSRNKASALSPWNARVRMSVKNLEKRAKKGTEMAVSVFVHRHCRML